MEFETELERLASNRPMPRRRGDQPDDQPWVRRTLKPMMTVREWRGAFEAALLRKEGPNP